MTTEEIKQNIVDYANGCGIDPNVAIVQLARESANFRTDVVFGPYVGGSGERGLAQFTPDTWARFGSGPHTNAYDIYASLNAWCGYMQYLLGLFGWDIRKALIGYNGGEGHLTDPGRFGAPSQDAQAYADAILAQAGAASQTPPDDGSGQRNWILIGAVGLGIFALVMAFRD